MPRIKDYPDSLLPSDLDDIINIEGGSLSMDVDSELFNNAYKIDWTDLITSAAVLNGTNNYQAMTPAAFYGTTATEGRLGISQLATDANITSKSSSNVITSAKQGLMQTNWYNDWFVFQNDPVVGLGKDPIPKKSENPIGSNGGAMSFDFNYRWGSVQNGWQLSMFTAIDSGKVIGNGCCRIIIEHDLPTFQEPGVVLQWNGKLTGGTTLVPLTLGYYRLRITDGEIKLECTNASGCTNVKVSASFNIMIR